MDRASHVQGHDDAAEAAGADADLLDDEPHSAAVETAPLLGDKRNKTDVAVRTVRAPCFGFMSKLRGGKAIELIRSFSPMWFASTMGTGIVALLMFNFPFAFQGQRTMVWVFFILNTSLLCLYTAITLVRALLFPSVWGKLLRHPAESMFLGCVPMSMAMVVNGLIFLADYSPDMMIRAAYIIWWIMVSFSILSVGIVPYFMMVHQEHSMEKLTAVWLLPIVPSVVSANSGGLLAPLLGQGQAFIVIVTSYLLHSLSMPLALSVIVLLLHRLFVHKLPAVEVIMSCLLPVGPLGMSSLALVNLGKACAAVFHNPEFLFSPNAMNFGVAAEYVGIMLALLLNGYALWWFVLVVVILVRTFVQKTVPFSLGWWALTFPIGVLALAQLAIGNYLEYVPLIWLGACMCWLVFLNWAVVFCRTAYGAWTGEIFVAPSLPASL